MIENINKSFMEVVDENDPEIVKDALVAKRKGNVHDKVRQSYTSIISKFNFNYYQKNILVKIVEFADEYDKGNRPVELALGNLIRINILKSEFIINGRKSGYTRLKEALLDLRNKCIEKEYVENGERKWKAMGVIELPVISKKFISFYVHKEFWNILLEYSKKGYRAFDIQVAMKIKPFSYRFYTMVSEQGEGFNVIYEIEYLKELLNVEGKYSEVKDFIKFVVRPSKEELDKVAPWSFDYKLLCSDRMTESGPGKKAKYIVLIPKKLNQNTDPELLERELANNKTISLRNMIGIDIYDYLTKSMGIPMYGLNKNKNTVIKFAEIPNALDILRKTAPYLKTANNPTGYVINTMKDAIKGKTATENKKKIRACVGNAASKSRETNKQPTSIGNELKRFGTDNSKSNGDYMRSTGTGAHKGMSGAALDAERERQKEEMRKKYNVQ